jgi:hypothetical protein
MYNYACKKSGEKVMDNIMETWDTILAETLQQEVQKDDWYSVRELTSSFLQLRGEEADDKEWRKLVSHSTKWVGRALKRFKLVTQKKKVHGTMQVYLHHKAVLDFAGRLGLPDYKPSEGETTQTTPTIPSDGQLQLEEL